MRPGEENMHHGGARDRYARIEMLDLLRLLGGGGLLYFGASWLVGGAAGLARSFGVSSLLIGLTVVAYGTSTPELLVGIQSAIDGHRGIALGNVLGSNIANLGLILGATAALRATHVAGELRRREVPVLMLSALLVPLLLRDGEVTPREAGALLVAAIGYTGWTIRSSVARGVENMRGTGVAAGADPGDTPPTSWRRTRFGALTVVGLIVLIVGGQLFVNGAVGVARAAGMSERVVGLTIVAVGTSVPELATSLLAAWRGQSEIAVGNVVGSNIFNILLCLGAASLAGPVGAPLGAVALDVGFLIGLSTLGCLLMHEDRTISRVEGALLLTTYAAFVALLLITG